MFPSQSHLIRLILEWPISIEVKEKENSFSSQFTLNFNQALDIVIENNQDLSVNQFNIDLKQLKKKSRFKFNSPSYS